MGDRIDWAAPLVAVDLSDGTTLRVAVDPSYANHRAGTAVKLARNVWTRGHDGGTWYFNDDGLAIGGIGKDGYEGRYRVRNAHG